MKGTKMSEGCVQVPRVEVTGRNAKILVLFLTAYVAMMTALRGQFDVRYNDTTNLSMYLNYVSKECSRPEFWRSLWLRTESNNSVSDGLRPDAYRPLQFVYGLMSSKLYFRFGPLPDYMLCFVLLGLSGYLIFRLFQEIGSTHLAWVCTAAYLFFPSVVSPAWNPLIGPQSIIPGAYAAGLWAYLRYGHTRRRRYLAVIALICAVGPLYKETIGVLPFLLLAHQLFVVPVKRWGLMAGLVVGCFHGVFPAAAVTFAMTGRIHLVTIFHCGALHDHASAQTWRPNFLMDLVAFVPPSLLLASLVCIAIRSCIHAPILRLSLPTRLTIIGIILTRIATIGMALGAVLAFIALISHRHILPPYWASLLAFLAIGAYGLLYVDALVAGWFFCMFLPLLRIYFNTTQCGYVAAPLIFLSVAPLNHCWHELAGQEGFGLVRRGFRYGLLAVGILAFCDTALSVPNSWIAYRKTEQFNERLFPSEFRAVLSQPNTVKQWTYLDNTVVVDDAVILSSRFHLGRGAYNFNYGVPPSNVIQTVSQLNRVLDRYNCFLIFADYVNPYRGNFWDLKTIQPYFLNISERSLRFDAYYLDPLRFYYDNRYRSMMAPPDFQDEFARDTKWFRERFRNQFHLCVRGKGAINLDRLR